MRALQSFYGTTHLLVCSVSKNKVFEFSRRQCFGSLVRDIVSDTPDGISQEGFSGQGEDEEAISFTDYHCRPVQECNSLDSLRLPDAGSAPCEALKGAWQFEGSAWYKEVSITHPRDKAYTAEKSPDDAEPVSPRDLLAWKRRTP